jgi:hypothetical protein
MSFFDGPEDNPLPQIERDYCSSSPASGDAFLEAGDGVTHPWKFHGHRNAF